ncbi:hypothetical protein HYW43_04335 [Candidatus Daviesbacteria bacterium]|nr:hypothetical protein [Candidatus Daviesbacteria bacterium]
MDSKLRQEKLKMWKDNLKQLEEQLGGILIKKGQAAQEGDLSENAAYTMAIEDADTTRVRIEEVKKIIKGLEGEDKGKA